MSTLVAVLAGGRWGPVPCLGLPDHHWPPHPATTLPLSKSPSPLLSSFLCHIETTEKTGLPGKNVFLAQWQILKKIPAEAMEERSYP